jgi:hypothetical protein
MKNNIENFSQFINEKMDKDDLTYRLEDKWRQVEFKEFFDLAEEKGFRPQFAKQRPNLDKPTSITRSDIFEITTPKKGEVFFVEKGNLPFVTVRSGFTTNASNPITIERYDELLDELLMLDKIRAKYFSTTTLI